jgi:chemotaxis protein methyltransferase CheR
MNTQEIEIRLLLEAMHLSYGYDFSGYSLDMLTRRILDTLSKSHCSKVADLIPKVLYDPEFFSSLIYNISIPVTEMFRDPSFYYCLRQQVLPVLRTYPYLNVWHAGCATGEEVYSMAILLKEEGLYDKCQIYATDINDIALQKARDGIYGVGDMAKYTQNYQRAGGTGTFSDYYHAKYDCAKIDASLKEKVTYANHNLVTDGVFGEMNLILCRNVFIYFNRELQNKVLKLFLESLCRGGYLCLGNSESLRFSSTEKAFKEISQDERIYQENQLKVMQT